MLFLALCFGVAFGVAFPSCHNVTVAPSQRCVWNADLFVDELPIPDVWKDRSVVSLDAQLVQHRYHSHLPMMPAYGYAGLVPGPTIVVKQDGNASAALRVELANSLPKEHLLPVDTRIHHVFSTEPVLAWHLHGAKVRARFDGNPRSVVVNQSVVRSYFYFLSRRFIGVGDRETRFISNEETETRFYHDHAHGSKSFSFLFLPSLFHLLLSYSSQCAARALWSVCRVERFV